MMNSNCSGSICPDNSQCPHTWKVSYNGEQLDAKDMKIDPNIEVKCKGINCIL